MTVSLRRLALALLFTGCSYRAGSFGWFEFVQLTYPAGRVTAGCLDIGVGAHVASRDYAPVVMYAFGNRCDTPVEVDLRGVRAWGVVATGEQISLVAHDPSREIRPRRIAAFWAGSAAIKYLAEQRGIKSVFVEVCVELAWIVPELTNFSRCFDPRRAGAS